MITKLILKNFKSIREQVYEFTHFDLLVGRNNSAKSTVLQSLAIWQFCIDAFHRAKRSGSTGIQVVLPNFTALPVPEFNLLWTERTDRRYPKVDGKRKQEYILIEIEVTWRTPEREEHSFGVKLRYNSPQSIYAIPAEGWERFLELAGSAGEDNSLLPVVVYVPPFSGLEDTEKWIDDSVIRQEVGKAQPGRVLRNLLLRVWEKSQKEQNPQDWSAIQQAVRKWFSVELQPPKYEHAVDIRIICEYKQGDKFYDIIAGGSGFHQTLTLLAFLFGYHPDTMLLDEPDAHLHVHLQREVLDYFKYFKTKSIETNTQFLIATHAEEFVRGVQVSQIISFLYRNKIPKRVESTPEILTAMAEVTNPEIAQLADSPVMLYVEGEDDERLLRAWSQILGTEETLDKVCFHFMRGGSKKDMTECAGRHFAGVQQIIPEAKRFLLLDYDSEDTFHPEADNPALYEWQRKNIENYLLVPEAWGRAALHQLGLKDDLLAQPIKRLILDFFAGENLTLPPRQVWRSVRANIFKRVDGKRILFENEGALFQQLRHYDPAIELTRETIARGMTEDEIHDDVRRFFDRLDRLFG